MVPLLGWILIICSLVCIGGPFLVWLKLKKLRKALVQSDPNFDGRVPSVTHFGSYRKCLTWIRRNRYELPMQFRAQVDQVLLFYNLSMMALAFIFVFALFNVIAKSL